MQGKGPIANIGVALGSIIACRRRVYTAVGLVVQAVGTGWIERFMPPVVTGAVVAVIGLNLTAIPVRTWPPTISSWMHTLNALKYKYGYSVTGHNIIDTVLNPYFLVKFKNLIGKKHNQKKKKTKNLEKLKKRD